MDSYSKTVLITGSNRGIGFEIASQLARKDFRVILSGRNKNALSEAAAKLEGAGAEIQVLEMDVGNRKSIQSAFSVLKEQTQRLDVLINNAGILPDENEPLLRVPEKTLQRVFQVNAFGPFYVIKAFLPLIPGGGRIINISSGAGSVSDFSTWAPVYSISKTVLNSFTRYLAAELRSKGITINAVCPGWVRTDMGGGGATRSVQKGAETPVWLATEAPLTITGRFLRDKKEIPF